ERAHLDRRRREDGIRERHVGAGPTAYVDRFGADERNDGLVRASESEVHQKGIEARMDGPGRVLLVAYTGDERKVQRLSSRHRCWARLIPLVRGNEFEMRILQLGAGEPHVRAGRWDGDRHIDADRSVQIE